MPQNKYLHHKHRKRISKKDRELIDSICLVAAVFMPLTVLPQIIQLYTSKDASGLSLLMWLLYFVGVIPFLLYGIIHQEKQLIILNVLWMIMQTLMVIGIILYN